jgi:hypothetical protein
LLLGALLIGQASLIGAITLSQVFGAVGRTSALQAHAMSAAEMAQMARGNVARGAATGGNVAPACRAHQD